MLAPVAQFSGGICNPLYDGARCDNVALQGGIILPYGTCLGQVPGTGANVNERWTITVTGTPTGGTFTLFYGGAQPITIAYNATGQQAVDAINAVLGVGTVSLVSGGPLPGGAVVIEFINEAGALSHALPTTAAAFTGGTTPAVAVTRTQVGKPAGGFFAAYNDANADGTQTLRRILKYDVAVNQFGYTTYGQGIDPGFGANASRAVPAWFHGVFRCSDLKGLDANGVADVGRLITGTAFNDSGAVLAMNGGG